MPARLEALTPGRWQLVGEVQLEQAPELAAAVSFQESSLPAAQTIELQDATGGTALLLVLLAWYRQAQAASLTLTFKGATPSLQRLVALSDLEAILPLV